MNFRERMSTTNLNAILSSGETPVDGGNKFFQLMRIDNAEHFLELRFRDGIKTAFSYDRLFWVNYSPETSMLDMDFMGTTVSIEGRGLGEIFQALKSRKVSWVKEADSDLEDNDSNSVFIKELTILPPASDFDEEKVV